MGRHQIPRHLRRRLIAAGTAAVCILGTAVGIGIYGAAQADNEAAPPVPCLPAPEEPPAEEAPPEEAPGEEAPPEEAPGEEAPGEEAPPEEAPGEEAPGEEAPGEEAPGEEAPGEEAPPEEAPGEEAPGEEAPGEEAPGEETATEGYGLTSAQGARPRGQQPTEEEQPPAEEEQPPAEEQPEEQPPAEEEQPPAEEEQPPAEDPGNGNEMGPQPGETVPPVDEEAPEDGFGEEECEDELGPFPEDFVDIQQVDVNNGADGPPPGEGASTGTFIAECGNNENGNFNSDNFIAAAGTVNGAEHTHDYVGNQDANAQATNESLVQAETSCVNQEDQSAYFWPVLRVRDENGGGTPDEVNAHNVGDILPVDATLEFRGNAQSEVTAMPQFLRVLTGNARSFSQQGVNQNAKWTCTGFEDRITDRYPLCPEGSQLVRIADFPGCWDGANTDSANHRDHVAFANEEGACEEGFVAIPQLRITLRYDIPPGRVFAVDAFPTEFHSPVTDHNDFVNVMSENLMDQVVECINGGQNC